MNLKKQIKEAKSPALLFWVLLNLIQLFMQIEGFFIISISIFKVS